MTSIIRFAQYGVKDKFGRVWNPPTLVCSACGQPDDCGDCNHKRLEPEEVRKLGGRIEVNELHRDADWHDGKETTHIGYEQDVGDIELAKRILAMPVGDDRRSAFKWFRLANGGLILGVFPHGDTYFSTEHDREI